MLRMRALVWDAVGDDADLPAGEADRLHAQRLDGHRHQRDRPARRSRGACPSRAAAACSVISLGQVDQLVGRVAAGADDDDDLVPAALGAPMARRAAARILSALADAKSRPQEGWIGGDGAHSIDLGNNRTLWLFDDTWVGTVKDGRRSGPGSFTTRPAFNAGLVRPARSSSARTRRGNQSICCGPRMVAGGCGFRTGSW